ncbi:MAG: stage II sporulation protein M [Candidatus Aenigmatarchaeota archaeon]
MVLEKIISARKNRKHPLNIFLMSFLISIISIFISYTVFKQNTGLFTVVLISLVMVPFMNNMLFYEEIETEETGEKEPFFKRHGDVISAYVAVFCGMVFAMSVAFVALPQNLVEIIFQEQINEVKLIQGKFSFGNQFLDILTNNISVLMLAFLFSFLLGTGAVLIIAWNASVLSAAIGLIANNLGGLRGMPIAVMAFIPHGTFELTAYFISAIAGGLLSVAVTRKKSKNFWYIIKDSFFMMILAIIFIIIGAIIETFIIIM